MIGNYNPEKIKQLMLKSIKKSDFIENLIKEHQGNEEVVLNIIQDTFEEIVKDSSPFRWEPVTPEQFLSDPYFLGPDPVTGEGVAATLHEQLKKEFCEIHRKDSPYSEVILTGGIGWGKSFFMEISMIWQLYLLSCLKYPQRFFGLGANTKIALMIISITEKQSKKNIFSGIKEALKKIPYFIENFQFDPKRATESMIFPNNIEIMNATSEHSSTIGLNIYSACLDEANFFKKVANSKRAQEAGEIYDEALVLYQSVRRRLDARFLQNGHKPGIFYIGSSKVYPNDFTANQIEKSKELERETGIQTVHVMDYNLWTVNRERYSTEEFKVMIGSINSRSRIIDEFDNQPIVGEVIHVPMDFYDKFRKDLDNAIRDIAGVAIYTVQPFIGNKEYIGNAFLHGEQIGLTRIFSVDEATLSPKPQFLQQEYILPHKIRKPDAVRYVGIDIGVKKDKFGFALGYIDGHARAKKEFFNAEKQTFDVYEEKMPKIVIEMLLTIKKEEEFGEVELARVRNLILQLIKFGYKIRQVSMDGYQSTDMFQILKRYGIEGTYISMDKTTEPYETYRSALYEERICSIYNQLLELELNELERDYIRNKIDHNPRGCFLGDTKIKLLNGTNVPISELVGLENVELYGCFENGLIVPTKAKRIFETKKIKQYLEIQIDNGEIIKCTDDHRFMMRDGSYKEAKDLLTRDSLMSLDCCCKIVSIKKILLSEEVPVYDIEVPLTSNFALSAGIFVHNSKDLSDAAGQIVYNMHINPIYNDMPLLPVSVGTDTSNLQTYQEIIENFEKWARD